MGKITEIVCAHFPTINGILRTHPLLIKACPVLTSPASARRRHHCLRVRGQARVVDNLRPRVFSETCFRQQPDDVVPLDKLPFLIEQEAAVSRRPKAMPYPPVFNNGLCGCRRDTPAATG